MANTSFKSAFKSIEKNFNSAVKKKRSQVASEINKELTATRKEVVEDLITKTGLKRKALNDRLSISRANPNDDTIEGRITPLYGKRIYMSEYPTDKVSVRGGKSAIRLESPIYRKNMRTGFKSADGKRIYLRDSNNNITSVKGRSVPRLFDEGKFKDTFETQIVDRIRAIIAKLFD